MTYDAAVIGGTGMGDRLEALGGSPVRVRTAHGLFRARSVRFGGKTILVVPRHGGGHRLPPHRVAYATMALGLAALQVPVCFSTAAVGSLCPDWAPGSMAVCTDTIDVSARRLTLYSDRVQHTDVSHPFPAAEKLRNAAEKVGVQVHPQATYVNVDGPRYETPAEISSFQGMGGHVVGMTAGSEAVVMAEAGVSYACLAIVTNLAAGLGSGTLDHGDVGRVMKLAGDAAWQVLETAVAEL